MTRAQPASIHGGLTAPTLYPASAPRERETFGTLDALAAHLVRARPGRALEFLPQSLSRGGEAEIPVVAVFARRPAAARQRARDGAFAPRDSDQDDWLGFAAGPQASDADQLAAAVARVRTAGGMAA